MLYITQSARNYVLMNFRKREKGMDEKKLGPLLSDEQFFCECLNLDYPGMEAVKEAVADKNYSLAIYMGRIIIKVSKKWEKVTICVEENFQLY